MTDTITLTKAILFTLMFVALELLLGFGAAALVSAYKEGGSWPLIVVLTMDITSMCGCLYALVITWIQYSKKE